MHAKQFYPSFLLEFKGRPFDAAALHSTYHAARIGGKVRGESEMDDFFREYKIDEQHWEFHQRILHDDVLYRLLSEGYLHPTIHPVVAIYYDTEFYPFVFPFIHTAILKKMADAIARENSEVIKLIWQWIEPYGNYFHRHFYRMIEFTAEELLKELDVLRMNRKSLPFGTYSHINPALMHLLNRLPPEYQDFRDRFAIHVLEFATWLRSEMKVYTQPGGLLTRLKLLNASSDVHAQISIQLKQWEQEKEQAGKPKFNLNHLIWIIPLFFIAAFVIFRNTDFGRSSEDIIAEQEMSLLADQQQEEEKWEKIRLRMENVDLNQLIVEELFTVHALETGNPTPVEPGKDPKRLDTGDEPYKMWLQPGREIIPTRNATLEIANDSEVDMIVFLRQDKAPFRERAYYIRANRTMSVYDDGDRKYYLRIYAGSGWSDSLVAADYDQKLTKAGVPEEAKDQFPSTTGLRGRFLYPVKTIEQDMQPVYTEDVRDEFVTPDGTPLIRITGNRDGLQFGEGN